MFICATVVSGSEHKMKSGTSNPCKAWPVRDSEKTFDREADHWSVEKINLDDYLLKRSFIDSETLDLK